MNVFLSAELFLRAQMASTYNFIVNEIENMLFFGGIVLLLQRPEILCQCRPESCGLDQETQHKHKTFSHLYNSFADRNRGPTILVSFLV